MPPAPEKVSLPENPHALDSQAILDLLTTSQESGLTSQQVSSRYDQFGRNKLPDPNNRSPWLIFLLQFKSTIVYILIIAAIISFIYNHLLDVYIIVGIVIINAIVGFIQEFKAERSIEALKQLIIEQVTAIRDGKSVKLSAHELVPGDIIHLEEGNQVPADARLLSVKNLQTVEASLTGESLPLDKDPATLSKSTPMAEMLNIVWMGTSVGRGSATAVVIATGTATALGKIAKDLHEIEESEDHFKIKSDELGKQMGIVALVSTGLMFVVGYFIRNFTFEEIFMFSVASLVSAIPEGLPVILTIVLALSAQRMAKRNAIVRRLSATETLSVVDTIITDKTGTLTQNQMTITAAALPYQSLITVTKQDSQIYFDQAGQSPTKKHYPLQKLLDIASTCHSVTREFDEKNQETFTGDPTEVALVRLADQAAGGKSYHRQNMTQTDDLSFSQNHRWRASLVSYENSPKPEVFVIGSPETVLEKTAKILLPDHKLHTYTKEHQHTIQTQIDELTSKGMRVLALAYKPQLQGNFDHNQLDDFVFVGLAGMVDPPRPETKGAIAAAHKAGVNVIMATGDHPVTATAIGLDLGLITKDHPEEQVITEADFQQLTDQEVLDRLDKLKIFARMTPNAKMRLAKLLQGSGKTVAMTGDGVNDAPALKQAHIGIGMGKNGTQVAREASDIILADDNFATIIAAIEEGRTQFRNVRRTSFFMITTNLAETLSLVIFLLIGLPLPLLPKQILWLNLISGGVTDMALATEQIHGDVLNGPPKPKNEPILNRQVIPFLIMVSGIMILLSLIFFLLFQSQGFPKARTATFAILSLTQLFNMLNLRSIKKSIFTIGIFTNRNVNIALVGSFLLFLAVLYLPFLSNIFEFVPLTISELLMVTLASTSVIWASELYKLIHAKKINNKMAIKGH
jgi:Ca2+-transporting ATPase